VVFHITDKRTSRGLVGLAAIGVTSFPDGQHSRVG
jgi:hypothetical protein